MIGVLWDFFSKHPGKVSTTTVAFSVTFVVGIGSFVYAVWVDPKLFDTAGYQTCLATVLGGTALPQIATTIKGVIGDSQ